MPSVPRLTSAPLPVAGAGAGEGCQVAFARAVHEGLGGEGLQPRVAGDGDGPHAVVASFGGRNEAREHHGHSRRRGQVVEDGLHRLRLEGDVHAPMPVRSVDGALLAQALHDLFANAANDAARRLAEGVKARNM